uniref:PLAC domain-containing protein n=1 Tax=Clastoptera arizonana TaxID=38151 RepID=A0A1B6DYX2_9HEMI
MVSRRCGMRSPRNHCLGLYRRVNVCNTQTCPNGKEFRQEQCEKFNGNQFLGRSYTWEAFLDAPNQCALNCRAKGYRFYATLNSTVEDGTACRGYVTAPNSGKWVCLTGECKHVGCDGVVDSDKLVDACGVCGGNNSTCQIVSGLFTRPKLSIGYNLITKIPSSACNLSISELKQSKNHLALRRPDGSFVINGNFAINWSGDYQAAGANFKYIRENDTNPESIYSDGPLQEPLDLMLIYQQPNTGIKYQYQLPMLKKETIIYPVKASDLPNKKQETNTIGKDKTMQVSQKSNLTSHTQIIKPDNNGLAGPELQGYPKDEPAKPRKAKRKRKFMWINKGFTECSRTCSGGVQTSMLVCVREKKQTIVPDKRCALLVKPQVITKKCNLRPCVAEWVPGDWSECSVTCGEGVETRKVICRQEISSTLTMTVADGACMTPPSPLLQITRSCTKAACSENKVLEEWTVGPWNSCSTKCGPGYKTRYVICPSGNCPTDARPQTQTTCDLGPCHQSGRFAWFYSNWSEQCSVDCGTGIQTRKVRCSGVESQCDATTKPEMTRTCSSDKYCGGHWHTGPWQQCSAGCGWGRQSRSVVCVVKQLNELAITSEKNCEGQTKPPLEQQCRVKICGSEWFTTDWSQCSKSCDTGVQRREVRCLDENYVLSNLCKEAEKPSIRRSCNIHACSDTNEKDKKPLNEKESPASSNKDNPNDQAIEQNLPANDDAACIDQFSNCRLVVQARLCKYKYYNSSCCRSCLHKT